MQCRFCHFDNRGGVRFCEECGEALTIECHACGTRVPADRKFCGSCGATLGVPGNSRGAQAGTPLPGASAAAVSGTRSESTAERRQLTVMFSDLVGYTALSRRLDPEDMREVTAQYRATCTEQIEQFGGSVARFMGDGVMAFFGYPHAHEDDAERAVRAALGIVQAVGAQPAGAGADGGSSLAVRIGIATGLVVVGDLIGEGPSEEWSVTGETPNLAARLQAVADPDSVVLAPETRNLAGDRFEYEDLGTHQLKGFSEPVRVWRAIGLAPLETRFKAARRGESTPLVAREEELAALEASWQQVVEGEGQLVLISGEPGIGKSRLTETFCATTGANPGTMMVHQCSPYHVNSAFYPVIVNLERAAGFAPGDDAHVKLEKLEALLAESGCATQRAIPLVAALLSVATGERFPPLGFEPAQLKEETLAVLLGRLERLARDRRVVCIFEDLHWADASTLEYIDRLVRRIRNLPVLVLATFRPVFAAPWTQLPHVTSLVLDRVNKDAGRVIVDSVAAGKALPPEVLAQILEKTDGVPLFIEELTRTVLDSEVLVEEADRYSLARTMPALGIPATLQDSLMARLDRSPSEKQVAQVAAVIGRVFSKELLDEVVSVRNTTLTSVLSRLQDAGIIYRQSSDAGSDYEFKHALLRDAAYHSMLKSVRQAHHERIASALEAKFPAVATTQPELLAHHYSHANQAGRAIVYRERAGHRAMERSANIEALGHFDKAMELLASLADPDQAARQELTLQLGRGVALTATEGYGTTAVREAYERATQLCATTGDEVQMFAAMLGLWRVSVTKPDFSEARKIVGKLSETARRLGHPEMLLMGHGTLGITLLFLGELEDADPEFEEAVARYDPELHHQVAMRAGQDPGVTCMMWSALGMWLRGRPEQARERRDHALALARRLSHQFSLAYALRVACTIAHCSGNLAEVKELAEELRALAVEKGFEQMLAAARIFEGCSALAGGVGRHSIEAIRHGMEEYERKGVGLNRPYFEGILASSYGLAGEFGKALDTLEQALQRVTATRERWYEVELYRIKAQLLLRSEALEGEVDELFRRAISVARSQGAISLELRAASARVRELRNDALRERARAELAEVCGKFEGRYETAELDNARALLAGGG